MPSRIFALRLFAEAVEFGHLSGFASGFELLDGFDAEFFVERLDFFRAEAGDVPHLDQAGRDGGFEFVVVGKLAGRDEFGDFLLGALRRCL